MTIRQKRIIFIAIGIILIGLIILLIYWLLIKEKPAVPSNVNINKALPYNPPALNTNTGGFKTPTEKNIVIPSTDEIQIKTLSLNYSEKFGSYSNQSNLANFSDLMSLSTPSMQNYLNNLINIINSESDAYYHGITTKALNVQILNQSNNNAETKVTSQRQETDESQNILNRVFYQDLKLKLVKSNDQWLVDGAWWQ